MKIEVKKSIIGIIYPFVHCSFRNFINVLFVFRTLAYCIDFFTGIEA